MRRHLMIATIQALNNQECCCPHGLLVQYFVEDRSDGQRIHCSDVQMAGKHPLCGSWKNWIRAAHDSDGSE